MEEAAALDMFAMSRICAYLRAAVAEPRSLLQVLDQLPHPAAYVHLLATAIVPVVRFLTTCRRPRFILATYSHFWPSLIYLYLPPTLPPSNPPPTPFPTSSPFFLSLSLPISLASQQRRALLRRQVRRPGVRQLGLAVPGHRRPAGELRGSVRIEQRTCDV
jgi:hypothetical protein